MLEAYKVLRPVARSNHALTTVCPARLAARSPQSWSKEIHSEAPRKATQNTKQKGTIDVLYRACVSHALQIDIGCPSIICYKTYVDSTIVKVNCKGHILSTAKVTDHASRCVAALPRGGRSQSSIHQKVSESNDTKGHCSWEYKEIESHSRHGT